MINNIIISGLWLDRCGKDTQCDNLFSYFNGNPEENPARIFRSTKIKNQLKPGYERYYSKMFESFNDTEFNNLFNRFHFDEYVYSVLYKDYDPNYIWDIERNHIDKHGQDNIIMFLLLDDPESAIKRDDGLGYTSKIEGIAKEKKLFEEAFERSAIKNKYIINIQDFDLNTDKAFEFIKSKL